MLALGGKLLHEIERVATRSIGRSVRDLDGHCRARINLEFTPLVAPIDGIAGQAQLQVGALVSPASGSVRAAWLSLDAGDAPLLNVSNGIKLGV
jgi:hypothetical protein